MLGTRGMERCRRRRVWAAAASGDWVVAPAKNGGFKDGPRTAPCSTWLGMVNVVVAGPSTISEAMRLATNDATHLDIRVGTRCSKDGHTVLRAGLAAAPYMSAKTQSNLETGGIPYIQD